MSDQDTLEPPVVDRPVGGHAYVMDGHNAPLAGLGVIEIQGDQRDRLAAVLEGMGYKVKRVGG